MTKNKPDLFETISKKLKNLSAKHLIMMAIFIVPLYFFVTIDINPDIYFMLNNGKLLINHGFVKTEMFTVHQGLYITIEKWLYCLIAYGIYSIGGFPALDIANYFLLVILAITIYINCKMLSKDNVMSALTTALIMFAFTASFSTKRPTIPSSIIYVTEWYCLEKFISTKNKKYLYPLPILSMLLIWIHSTTFPVFFIVSIPFFFDNLTFPTFNNLKNKEKINDKNSFNFNTVKTLGIWMILSFLSTFINPYGIDSILYIFNALRSNIGLFNITEMRNTTIFLFPYTVIVFPVIHFVHLLINPTPMKFRYFFTFYGFFLMALMIVRNFSYFIILGGPLVSIILSNSIFSREQLKDMILPLFVSLYSLSFCIAFVNKVDRAIKYNRFFFEPNYLYSELLTEDNITPTDKDIKIYTNYNKGSAVEWLGYKSYVDSRAEVFAKEVNRKEDIISEYTDIQEGRLLVDDIQKKYDFDYYLLNTSEPFVAQIDRKLIDAEKVAEKKGYILYKVKKTGN